MEFVWLMEHGISMVPYGYYILSFTTHHLIHTWFNTMLHAQPTRMFAFRSNLKIVQIVKYYFLGNFKFDLIMDVFIMVCIRALYMFVFVFSIFFEFVLECNVAFTMVVFEDCPSPCDSWKFYVASFIQVLFIGFLGLWPYKGYKLFGYGS